MKLIGLTGGIGAGKSTLCEVASTMGIGIIDTDHLNRQLLSKQDNILKICQHFRWEYSSDDNLRARLRQKLLDKGARLYLEELLHPQIYQCAHDILEQHKGNQDMRAMMIALPLVSGDIARRWTFHRKLTVECHKILTEQRLIRRYGRNEKKLCLKLSQIHAAAYSQRQQWAEQTLWNNTQQSLWEEKCRQVVLTFSEL